MKLIIFCLAFFADLPSPSYAADAAAGDGAAGVPAFKSRLLTATTRHLNMLLGDDGSVAALKGKGGDGEEFIRAAKPAPIK